MDKQESAEAIVPGRGRAESIIQGAAMYVSRDMRQQKTAGYQMELPLKPVCHGTNGEGGTGSDVREERQVSSAADRKRALTQILKMIETAVVPSRYARWCERREPQGSTRLDYWINAKLSV